MICRSDILAAFLMLSSAHGALATGLLPYDAVYENKRKGFNVLIKRRLQVQDGGVTVTADAKSLWVRVHESSTMIYRGESLLYTTRYLHERHGVSHDHDMDLNFNWDDGTVTDLLEPDGKPLAVDTPTYGKLGYQTQLRLDLMRDPDLQHIEYAVTNGFRNRIYCFDRRSDEVLKTPIGKLNTIKFERSGDDDERQVFFWVATDWDYLLVRLDQTKAPGEKTERIVLKRAKIDGKTVTGL